MSKNYICVSCGSQDVTHTRFECENSSFEAWWRDRIEKFEKDVWLGKHKELARLAYLAGRVSGY